MMVSGLRSGVLIWVVWDHPSDFPDAFVARKWIGEEIVETDVLCARTLGALRETLQAKGLHLYPRHHEDLPDIVESWI